MSHIGVLLYWLWTRFVTRNWRHVEISKSLLWLPNAQRQPRLVSISCQRWLSQSTQDLRCWEHPMLVRVSSSPPGPSAGSTVVLREQPAAPRASLLTRSQIWWESPNVGATYYEQPAQRCWHSLLLQKRVHWWSSLKYWDTELSSWASANTLSFALETFFHPTCRMYLTQKTAFLGILQFLMYLFL